MQTTALQFNIFFSLSLCNRAIHIVKARFLLFRCKHGIILFKYIEIYYSQKRKHSVGSWKAPAHCEQGWYNLNERLNSGLVRQRYGFLS